MTQADPCPSTQIRWWPNFLAMVFFLLSIGLFSAYATESREWMNSLRALLSIEAHADTLIALVIMLVTVLPMLTDDMQVLLASLRKTPTPLKSIDSHLLIVKLSGLYGTLLLLAGIYWLLPEYGNWYQRFWDLLWLIMPVFVCAAPFYIAFSTRMAIDHKDSYYHAGLLFLGLIWRRYWDNLQNDYLFEHLRQWLIKGFFLPLMVIFFLNNVTSFLDFDYSLLGQGFKHTFDFMHLLLYSIDVVYAAVGYFFTFKLLNTDIRSAEPSLLGWLVCLLCYPPFWNGLVGDVYLKYDNGFYWGQWLTDNPVVYVLWGLGILWLILLYSLATVSLGYRFSNLTYRGLTTTGVYRWTKHPAYIAKNLSWWMVSVPFISQGDMGDAIRSSLLLLGVNYLYFLRAKTEERHLSHYPEYVEYANWINRHGLFRWVCLLIPALKYDEQKVLAASVSPWWKRLKAN